LLNDLKLRETTLRWPNQRRDRPNHRRIRPNQRHNQVLGFPSFPCSPGLHLGICY
jgi:hypothetical protein